MEWLNLLYYTHSRTVLRVLNHFRNHFPPKTVIPTFIMILCTMTTTTTTTTTTTNTTISTTITNIIRRSRRIGSWYLTYRICCLYINECQDLFPSDYGSTDVPTEEDSEERNRTSPVEEGHRDVVEGRQIQTSLRKKHIPVVNLT